MTLFNTVQTINGNDKKFLFPYLLCNIEGAGTIGVTPVTSESLTKDGVIRFLQSLWLLVETREIPAYHLLHSGERVILKYCPGGGMEREEIIRCLESRFFHEWL